MNDDTLNSLFKVYEAREPGRAYVEPFNDSNGNQKGWKASTKWGRVKYFGKDFKSSAEKHAGIDTSDNVNDRGMDEGVRDVLGAIDTGVRTTANEFGGDYVAAGMDYLAKRALGKRTTYKRELDQEFQKTDRATARNPTAASRGSIMGTAMSLAPMLRPLRAVTRAGKVAQGVAAFGAPMAKIGGDMATGRFNEDVPCAEPTTTDPKKPSSRFWASNSLTNIYKKDTPGQSSLSESYDLAFDYQGKPSIAPTAGNLMMRAQGAFAHHNDVQNVMDVRSIKESIEKTFQNTVLEEDAEQLEAKCEILQDMVEHALATIEEIKATNVERDAWSTAEIMKLERYIELVNA